LYSSFARWLSLLLVDIPTLFLGTCCFILIMYYMSGIQQNWFHFAYMVMFGSFLGYAQAQLCAHISHSAIQGFVIMAVLCCYQLVFSGYFVEKHDLPEWMRWAVYTSFMRWCTGQLMMNQFGGYLRHQGDLVISLFEYSNFEFGRSKVWVLLYFIGLELVILIALFIPKPTVSKLSPEDAAAAIATGVSVDGSNPLHAGGGEKEKEKEEDSSPSAMPVDDFQLEKDDVFTAAKALPQSKQVDFLFRGVTYTLQETSKNDTEPKRLLRGIDGAVRAGELCAVMGMSGSGALSFLGDDDVHG
jgi:ABC-type transport system involved in cytochrome bd biosynthesis fused ATPase/permease subunit